MKLTGPACTETLDGAEKARTRKRKPDNAGGVRVERRVRPANPNDAHRACAMLDFGPNGRYADCVGMGIHVAEPKGKELKCIAPTVEGVEEVPAVRMDCHEELLELEP